MRRYGLFCGTGNSPGEDASVLKTSESESLPPKHPGSEIRPDALLHAIVHEHLFVHYQPQIRFPTGQLAGVEALVRWRHPQWGRVSPDDFIPLAEQTGLILPLSRWVLNSALRQSQRWGQEQPGSRLAVNLSMQNLQEPHCAQTSLARCDTWQVAPTRLTIGITESTRATDTARVHTTLTRLRQNGVWSALDDVGVGYASLAALHRLPLDECKIDKPFIFALHTDAKAAAIVQMLIELGHTLGLQVVAEGVADRATYDRLVTLGCDVIQGYYVSRPLSAAAVLPWWQRTRWQFQSTPRVFLGETFAPCL